MSLSSTSAGSRRRAARVAVAVAVAVAVLAPLAALCAQLWSGTGASIGFAADERRGAVYLRPLTVLLSVATEAQSAAVRGQPANVAAVREAVAAVDEVDGRLGSELRSTDRWTAVRATVQDRTSRSWSEPIAAYTQYSDLITALLELNRTVGDNSRLILDPSIDSYYVMNATLLRIPAILADSGRYADLSVLAFASGRPDATGRAQLATARNRIATGAADLSDGLVKAFARTDSSTLGPGLTRQLDNFRSAVDAVAPSSSLLAPAPQRSLADLGADQDVLQRAALDLQRAALDQLELLLADRQARYRHTRALALVAVAAGVLVAAGLATLAWRWHQPAPAGPGTAPGRPGGAGRRRRRTESRGTYGGDGRAGVAEPSGARPPGRPPSGPNGTPAPGRVPAEHPGGARAAR